METTLGKNAKGYNYTYTDLAQIHAGMEAQNLRYRQCIERIDGQDYIKTQVYNVGETGGDWLLGCKIVSAPLSGKSNAAQEQGSAITYARRYSLLMALGWATTDDDAECLTENNPRKSGGTPDPPPPAPPPPICPKCGNEVEGKKKGGKDIRPEEILEKCGMCVKCYRLKSKEANNA